MTVKSKIMLNQLKNVSMCENKGPNYLRANTIGTEAIIMYKCEHSDLLKNKCLDCH